jgi:hypothetical protein
MNKIRVKAKSLDHVIAYEGLEEATMSCCADEEVHVVRLRPSLLGNSVFSTGY